MERKKVEPGTYTYDEALAKLQNYCAYQDRCHKDVRFKLIDLGIRGLDLDQIMADLIEDKFLDELRFARSYTRSRFFQKKWGKIRIKRELKFRQISAYCLKEALKEISDEDYYSTVAKLLEKKIKEQTKGKEYMKKLKAVQFLVGKGYESGFVWEVLNEIYPKK